MTDGTADDLELATAELLGALTYGQLRGYTTAVALVPLAPDLERTERLLGFADRERDRYRCAVSTRNWPDTILFGISNSQDKPNQRTERLNS